MRLSHIFGRTLREFPADGGPEGLQWAIRAALLRPLEPGRYAWLPLGQRILEHARARLRSVMQELEGQEITLPASLQDPFPGPLLSMLAREVSSYRDLPRCLYAFSRQTADQPRGLWRWREWERLMAIILHTNPAERDRLGARFLEVVRQAFTPSGVETVHAEALSGSALLFPYPAGRAADMALIRCPACGYTATADAARFRLPPAEAPPQEELHPVPTPGCATIADVAAFVGVPTARTLKAVFYAIGPEGQGELVFVVIRGDLEVNEAKLRHLLRVPSLRPATSPEIYAAGAEPGYASPVGLRVRPSREAPGVLVIGDFSIQAGADFVAGANREGFHFLGVNYPRDFAVTFLADIAQARAGLPCARCGAPLEEVPSILLASWDSAGAGNGDIPYTDPTGLERPVAVGWGAVYPESWIAAVAESQRDAYGLVWPPVLAPFDVHLVALGREKAIQETAEAIYRCLEGRVLYDDRDESAGVKFTDADLIGCPVRVTVSRRSLEAGGVELKARWGKERRIVSVDSLPEVVDGLLRERSSESR